MGVHLDEKLIIINDISKILDEFNYKNGDKLGLSSTCVPNL